MQVRHILHGKGRDVISIGTTATLTEAAKLLTDRKIGALIVKDKSGDAQRHLLGARSGACHRQRRRGGAVGHRFPRT